MSFATFGEFLAMGTHGPYVWAAYGISLQDVVTALERNNGNVGAGYIEKQGEQLLIRAPGQVASKDDIGNIVVANV